MKKLEDRTNAELSIKYNALEDCKDYCEGNTNELLVIHKYQTKIMDILMDRKKKAEREEGLDRELDELNGFNDAGSAKISIY